MRRGRRVVLATACLVSALVACVLLSAAWTLGRTSRFDLARWLESSEPCDVREVGRSTTASGSILVDLEVQNSNGLVQATVRLPDATPTPRPAVLVLGGLDTGRRAAHLVETDESFVVAALDYAYTGPHRPTRLGFLRRLPEIWRGLLGTATAYRDLVRYVAQLPQTDATRIYLVGASLGVPITTHVASSVRPAGLVLLYGFSEHAVLYENKLREHVPFLSWRRAVAGWGAQLTAGFDAARALPRLCGVPVLLIGSDTDDVLPVSCTEALWQATCEPRERVLLPGGHIRVREKDVLHLVTDEVLAWLPNP